MRSVPYKTSFILFLILTLPLHVSIALADDPLPPPGDQCDAQIAETSGFVDFMDNGIIKLLEMIASLTFAIASIVNTVDTVLNVVGLVVGHAGPGGICCATAPFGLRACAENWDGFKAWENIKGNQIMQGIVAVGTCACCAGGKGLGESALATAGGAGGLCPL